MKLQPFGKVPVLQTDEVTIYECEAIIRYLSAHIPGGKRLVPKHHFVKAQMDKLLSIYHSYFKPSFFPIYNELVLKKRYGRGDPDQTKLGDAMKKNGQLFEDLRKGVQPDQRRPRPD